MKDRYLIKSWWLRNKSFFEVGKLLLFACLFFPLFSSAQIANYVTNGGFEDKYDCDPPYILSKAIGWNCIGSDTTMFGGFLYSVNCFSNAPNTGTGFQYPRTGNSFYRWQVYCAIPCSYTNSRIYPKNRLKSTLSSGKIYCVKMYVSLEDISPYAISNLSFYFGSNSIDSIKYYHTPLIYLNPQVTNPINNVITDTLNWVPITGTFTATGAEKYLVIGNFEPNATVTKTSVMPTDTNDKWTEYFVDDISCIDIDLPAFACADSYTYNIPGDSVFLGRQPDVGIDEDCMWYRLPNITTPIDTVAGFWAKPVTTTTYVVRQEICGNVKWDTVVVSMSALDLQDLRFKISDLRLYPIPAQDELKLQWTASGPEKEFTKGEILNSLGQTIKQVELNYNSREALINTKDLQDGVYILSLKSNFSATLNKRFVINH